MCFQACLWLCLVLFGVEGWSPTSRLQRDALPKSYSLKIVPDLKNETFSGEVTIFIEIQHSMHNITLNSKELSITEITLDQAFGSTKFELDPIHELLHVHYGDNKYINPGEHLLNVKFQGSLDGHFGFYMVDFFRDGIARKMLATKFSAIHARAAFPCFDEPFYKSIFSIRLVKPDNTWTALSNMAEIGSFETREGIAVDFQSTFPMSTYLIAWILTDYKYEELQYIQKHRKIPMRFFSGNENPADKALALEISKRSLRYFEEYSNISYPLPKLDSIEVPYYRSRGMEHWGLIVYLEKTATYNPDWFNSRVYHIIDEAFLISHELSHMWFGNLVTHEWYNDLWLTEGIARFMQYKATQSIIKEQFVMRIFQKQKFRSLFEVHCKPYEVAETSSYPRTLDEVFGKFGLTVYDQGAAVLLMIEDVIGPENIQKALRNHLKEHQYGHATTGDFINTLQEVVPSTNIRNIMETFLFQKKLPLISVSEVDDLYILDQNPLCHNNSGSLLRQRWTIPIRYITSTNRTSQLIWFDKDMINVKIPKHKNDKWIKINHLNKGLFRSQYSDCIYEGLQKDFQDLGVDNMGPLLEETFMLAGEESIACGIPLQLMKPIHSMKKIDYLTFAYASRSFSLFLDSFNFGMEANAILKSYFIHIFENIYHETPWTVEKNETYDHRLLRIAVLESLCLNNAQYDACYKDAKIIDSKNLTVHDDISYIYKRVLMHGEPPAALEDHTEPISTYKASNYEKECGSWVTEHIPKIMEEANKITE